LVLIVFNCGAKLNTNEIIMHKHVSITNEKEMSCQACWMKVAYQ